MAPVTLPRPLVNQLLQQAQRHPDHAAWGLIGSRDGQPTRCYPAQRRARPGALHAPDTRDEGVFAVYHSHPAPHGAPRAAELAATGHPGVLHLIISLGTRGVLEMRGFRLRDGLTEEVALEVGPGTGAAQGY
ncbi:MAG: hypothetical protein B7Z66_13215 [Chromatiales bacterium 21-64-14]|nr:MAG: hypothetical protein B7Z66_13215 [Chromatiales bacterium 21-64-14]HQU15232.1 hypothetical protein [Gammaproteobacteria bacterium]